jgi:PhnB protein
MTTINPYLNFNNNCEEAFNFYQSVFGGELRTMRFKDIPSEHAMPAGEGEKIMHMELTIGQGAILMGSDTPPGMELPQPGNNVTIAVHPTSEAEATRLFNGLSAGGQVTMPLEKTFWGAYFGMCIDKFGIHWMVNYQLA